MFNTLSFNGFSYDEIIACPAYNEGFELAYDLAYDAECPLDRYPAGTLEAFAFEWGFGSGVDSF